MVQNYGAAHALPQLHTTRPHNAGHNLPQCWHSTYCTLCSTTPFDACQTCTNESASFTTSAKAVHAVTDIKHACALSAQVVAFYNPTSFIKTSRHVHASQGMHTTAASTLGTLS